MRFGNTRSPTLLRQRATNQTPVFRRATAGEGASRGLSSTLSAKPIVSVASPAKRGRVWAAALVAFALTFPLAAYAVTPGEMLADPTLEARARAITSELRCLVCQNQSIDDSDASLAKDLRVLVREKLKEGMSDSDVREFVHSRYGDFVLLRPPMKPGTIFLWAAPMLALFAGAGAVWIASRRHRRDAPSAPVAALTQEERARLRAMGVDQPGK